SDYLSKPMVVHPVRDQRSYGVKSHCRCIPLEIIKSLTGFTAAPHGLYYMVCNFFYLSHNSKVLCMTKVIHISSDLSTYIIKLQQ
ncbi:MAG: hypothetical protein KAI96_06340, partial [Thermodesulfovibrionia bacterium]|nr:hypothetical protein [Thermodesulfovibrionia bacterium]